MENKILAILILGVFVAGALLGMAFQSTKCGASLRAGTVVKILSSPLVPSIVVYGQVENISGRNITLNYQSQQATINVADGAQIVSFADPANITNNKINFSDINVGDSINITVKLSPDGSLQGYGVAKLSGSK